jgi:ferrochelatase
MSVGGSPAERTTVLLMAYGTPRSRDEIEAYYTDIRRGRAPTAEQLADLTARYDALGGTSPLAARTEAQRVALQAALAAIAPDRYDVVLGLKHADPKIEAAVAEVAAGGAKRIVGLVLAPHYSAFSVGQYHDRARATAESHGMRYAAIDSWATEPAFVAFTARSLCERVAAVAGEAGASAPTDVKVVFTAHSLPTRIIAAGDPYPDQLRATAMAVAAQAGLDPWTGWTIAWQSAGRTPEPWLGPDILTVIDDLAAAENDVGRPRGIVVSAVGFVADHLEVLYDLDIEAARRAGAHGLAFARTECVNDDPVVMAALAARVVEADR